MDSATLRARYNKALGLLLEIYCDHRLKDSADSDWTETEDIPCVFCRAVKPLFEEWDEEP